MSGIAPRGDYGIPGEGMIEPRRSKCRIPIDISERIAGTLELEDPFRSNVSMKALNGIAVFTA